MLRRADPLSLALACNIATVEAILHSIDIYGVILYIMHSRIITVRHSTLSSPPPPSSPPLLMSSLLSSSSRSSPFQFPFLFILLYCIAISIPTVYGGCCPSGTSNCGAGQYCGCSSGCSTCHNCPKNTYTTGGPCQSSDCSNW